MSLTILINENSGSVSGYGKDAMAEKLRAALGADLRTLEFLSPDQFAPALRNISGNGSLLVGGGDGTIRTAAAALKNQEIPFGILPLGTMNQFAKDLELELDPFKLAVMYKTARTVRIDAATVNGEIFLCNAMIGLPPQFAREREKTRNKETFGKWIRLSKNSSDKLSFGRRQPMSILHHGTVEHKFIKAAVIANNEYEDRGGLGLFRKKSLTDGKLAVYTVDPEGTLESLAMLSKLALGSWENTAGLEYFDTKELTIDTPKREANILLDGEIRRLRTPLSFSSQAGALSILVPEK